MPSSSSPAVLLPSSPTRRSSDLFFRGRRRRDRRALPFGGLFELAARALDRLAALPQFRANREHALHQLALRDSRETAAGQRAGRGDRKSTRLNSSHLGISYAVFFLPRRPPPLFPYTTLFRSLFPGPPAPRPARSALWRPVRACCPCPRPARCPAAVSRESRARAPPARAPRFARNCGRAASRSRRSEEHTSELQSLRHLVCRLLPPPPSSSPLPLHDALPISFSGAAGAATGALCPLAACSSLLPVPSTGSLPCRSFARIASTRSTSSRSAIRAKLRQGSEPVEEIGRAHV